MTLFCCEIYLGGDWKLELNITPLNLPVKGRLKVSSLEGGLRRVIIKFQVLFVHLLLFV